MTSQNWIKSAQRRIDWTGVTCLLSALKLTEKDKRLNDKSFYLGILNETKLQFDLLQNPSEEQKERYTKKLKVLTFLHQLVCGTSPDETSSPSTEEIIEVAMDLIEEDTRKMEHSRQRKQKLVDEVEEKIRGLKIDTQNIPNKISSKRDELSESTNQWTSNAAKFVSSKYYHLDYRGLLNAKDNLSIRVSQKIKQVIEQQKTLLEGIMAQLNNLPKSEASHDGPYKTSLLNCMEDMLVQVSETMPKPREILDENLEAKETAANSLRTKLVEAKSMEAMDKMKFLAREIKKRPYLMGTYKKLLDTLLTHMATIKTVIEKAEAVLGAEEEMIYDETYLFGEGADDLDYSEEEPNNEEPQAGTSTDTSPESNRGRSDGGDSPTPPKKVKRSHKNEPSSRGRKRKGPCDKPDYELYLCTSRHLATILAHGMKIDPEDFVANHIFGAKKKATGMYVCNLPNCALCNRKKRKFESTQARDLETHYGFILRYYCKSCTQVVNARRNLKPIHGDVYPGKAIIPE